MPCVSLHQTNPSRFYGLGGFLLYFFGFPGNSELIAISYLQSFCSVGNSKGGSVKSYAQICFWPLVEIYYRGRLNRPLVTFQQAGRNGSRAAVRRLPCP